eukprot:COSAG06_NODE_1879_length_8153_cov_4.066178_5_plen_189_part_00
MWSRTFRDIPARALARGSAVRSRAGVQPDLTSFPFKRDAGDGAPSVATGSVAQRDAVVSTKADVEKLMAQNAQLMNAMMQQKKKLEIQEEITGTTKLMQQITAGAGSTTTAPPKHMSSRTAQLRQSLAKPDGAPAVATGEQGGRGEADVASASPCCPRALASHTKEPGCHTVLPLRLPDMNSPARTGR